MECTVEQAIARAIACSSNIAALQAALNVAKQLRLAATDIEDPEVSLRWERDSNESTDETWSTRDSTATGESTRNGTGLSTTTSLVPGQPSQIQTSAQNLRSTSASTSHDSSYQVNTGAADGNSYQVGFSVNVPNPWLLGPRVAARNAEIEAAQADLSAAKWQIAVDVKRAYAEIAHFSSDMKLAAKVLNLHDVMLGTLRNLVHAQGAQGSVSADVVAASMARIRAENDADHIRSEHDLALRSLANLLRVSPRSLRPKTSDVVGHTFALTPDVMDRLESTAIRYRASLAGLSWRLLAAREAYREARNGRIPWFTSLDASYGAGHRTSSFDSTTTGSGSSSSQGDRWQTSSGQSYETWPSGAGNSLTDLTVEQQRSRDSGTSQSSDSGTSYRSGDQPSRGWWVGFGISVPIFSWTVNHADDVLHAEYELAVANYEEGLYQVKCDVRNAAEEYVAVQKEGSRYQAGIETVLEQLRWANSNLRDVPGLASNQVAEIQLHIIQSSRVWREARLRRRLAEIDLELAVGVPLSDALKGVELQPDASLNWNDPMYDIAAQLDKDNKPVEAPAGLKAAIELSGGSETNTADISQTVSDAVPSSDQVGKDAEQQPDLASLSQIESTAASLAKQGDWKSASQKYGEALDLLEKLGTENPDLAAAHQRIAMEKQTCDLRRDLEDFWRRKHESKDKKKGA